MIKTSTFQIQIVCPGCNNYHAVSGISATDLCRNCGRQINVASVLHDKMFSFMDKTQYMNAFLSGGIEQMGGAGAYKLTYTSMPPYCEECKTQIDENLLAEAVKSGKPFTCQNCSHKMPVRGADAEIKEFHPKAIGVINDEHGADFAERNTDKDSMIVFKCMTCGAGLELTAKTERTIKCKYCDNENYLPDSIWTKIHPNKEVQPLFVILEIEEGDIKGSIDYFLRVTSLSIFSKHFDNFTREYFERPFIAGSLLAWVKQLMQAKNNEKVSFNMDVTRIRKYFYDNLKLGLSSHNDKLKETVAEYAIDIPVELQQGLSSDKSEKVRAALAKNSHLAKDIIKKLQSDPSPEVSSLAQKQKTGLFSKLFG